MSAAVMQGLATVAAWAVVASLGVFASAFLVVWAISALQSAAYRRHERRLSSMRALLRMEADRAWQWDESKTYRRRPAGQDTDTCAPVSGGRWDSDSGSDSGSDGGSSGGGE